MPIGITGITGEIAVKFRARSNYINCAKLKQGQRRAAVPVCYFHTAEPAAEARPSIFIAQISSKGIFYFLPADKKVSFWQSTMDTHRNYISDPEIWYKHHLPPCPEEKPERLQHSATSVI